MEIRPIPHPLDAIVTVPGSKSLTNRVLLLASLAQGTTRLTNALFSDDSRYFARALQGLGFDVALDAARTEMTVAGLGGLIPIHHAHLFIGNAGTAARFLTAFLALANGEYLVDGSPRMRERPIGDLAGALMQLGAHMETAGGCPPVRITASGLSGGRVSITGNVSSQFLSALLMVAPYARDAVEIALATELSSRSYVALTLAVMRDFWVEVVHDGYHSFTVEPCSYISPSTYMVESDASAASYFFAAPVICAGRVRVAHISPQSKQGDIAFLEVLRQMGCTVREGDNFIEVEGAASLRGIDVDLSDIPDVAQTLAVVAPFASSPTRIRGIASARLKETDRIHAVCTELARLGVRVKEYADGMEIHPCDRIQPATVQTYEDHRMAMAFSLIGLRVAGISIENPACVSKTFPGYFEVLQTLR